MDDSGCNGRHASIDFQTSCNVMAIKMSKQDDQFGGIAKYTRQYESGGTKDHLEPCKERAVDLPHLQGIGRGLCIEQCVGELSLQFQLYQSY